MIAFAELAIGSGGLLNCSRCAGSVQRSPRPLAELAPALVQIAAGWDPGPGPNVVLTGFEPFSHPELPAVISTAIDLGFERVRLSTDAGALGVGGNASGIVAAGVRQLEVVVLGPDAQTHDALAGRPGLHASMVAGLGALWSAVEDAGCDFFLCGRVPICAHNVDRLAETVASLAGRGAMAVTLDMGGRSLGERGARQLAAAIEIATVNSVAVFVPGDSSWDLPAPWTVIRDA